MFVVLYRWRVDPEKEPQFIAAWSEITAFYRENFDSLGSRLHRGDDGIFYAYAQWRSAEQRERAFAARSNSDAGAKLRAAVIQEFAAVPLEILADFLTPEKTF